MEGAPLTAEAHKAAGDDAYRKKSWPAAIAAYTQALALSPETAALYTNRAAASLMALAYKDAADDCDKAISLEPTNARAFFRKASALRGLGRLDETITCLAKGLDIDPAASASLKEKAQLVEARASLSALQNQVNEKGNYRPALTQLDTIIREIGGGFRDFNILRVICLIKLGRIEEGYNLSNAMMRSAAPGDVELLRVRADCLYTMGDSENALKHLQQAVRSDPDNTAVRSFYKRIREIQELKDNGATHFKNGSYQEAVEQWSAAIPLVSDNKLVKAKLCFNRATAYGKLKRNEEATSDLDTALLLDPTYLKAYLKRAEINLAIGGADRIKRSIEDYEKADELQGDESEEGHVDVKAKIKQAKVALKRAGSKDFYSILNISRDADEEEIRKAYRKLALKWHPDRHSSSSDAEKLEAETKFKAIGEAYEVLSDPEKKERYDSGVEPEDLDNPHAGHGHSHGHGGIDPNMLFQMFMAQQMGGGGGERGGRGGGFHFG